MKKPPERDLGHAPAPVVERAVQIAEAAFGLPDGTWHTLMPRGGSSNEEYVTVSRYLFALLGCATDARCAARTLGTRSDRVRVAMARWRGGADFEERVSELKELHAQIRDESMSPWPRLSGAPCTETSEIAGILGLSKSCVTAHASEAFRKLRRGLNRPSILSTGRKDLGRCVARAMRARAVAAAIMDIAEAAGADPMDVARAFVAARKGGAR